MKQHFDLGGTWQWRRVGEATASAGTVPGTVLADMLALGLAPDPYWRDNEYAVRELFTADFVYEKTFTPPPEAIAADELTLVLEGVDTLAEISLNGEPLATTADMHRTYRLAVKGLVVAGENRLTVTLRSSLNHIREADANSDITYASTGCLHGNAVLRKAHSMFGWDWGPQLPDAGIFRPIYLETASTARIADFKHTQRHESGRVSLMLACGVQRLAADASLTVRFTLTAPDGTVSVAETPLEVEVGEALAELAVSDPQLWWPNGWGAHPLYGLTAELRHGGETLDRQSLRIGLRTMRLCTAPDAWGSEFAFEVNGQRIFAMGANMIPVDSILPRVTPERTRRLVMDCAAANFNMLRVWGGGYYPSDDFYDACDEQGILVWQDLMFACNVYALTGAFEENIVAETRVNVARVRHHASLALWCGNNEMEWGWAEWARLSGHHPRYKRDYLVIFERILADVVAEVGGTTPWWPSSPSSGGSFYIPSSPDHGDQHYWEVWHSGKPFTEYRKAHFRFCSEYGFQSFPSMKTIRSFTLPEDRNIFGRIMESHQKNGLANSKIFTYVAVYFRYPKDMDAISYISQLLQLKAIQYGVEFWRQNRGRCMGSLYWQLNDCWPVASWASIDYHGRWKALHYGARRFYAPLMASALEKKELSGDITYYLHNDTRAAYTLTLEVTLRDADFNVLARHETTQTVPALTALPALHLDFEPLLTDAALRRRAFASYRMLQDGVETSRGTTLFVKPKHFDLPSVTCELAVTDEGDAFDIHVRAGGYACCVELSLADWDAVFGDNYFDIVDEAGVHVRLCKEDLPAGVTAADILAQLRVRSVRDTYHAEEE